jgi:hypothetical protein
MPRFGITGHVNLTADSTSLVRDAIVKALSPHAGGEFTGISCLAPGTDGIFAQVVLDLGGRLEVVIPSQDYASTVGADYAERYAYLVGRAASVRVLPFPEAGRVAYEAANHELVTSRLDLLFAVWDGKPDGKKGNTASVVAYARVKGVPIEILWPAGAARLTHNQSGPAER